MLIIAYDPLNIYILCCCTRVMSATGQCSVYVVTLVLTPLLTLLILLHCLGHIPNPQYLMLYCHLTYMRP